MFATDISSLKVGVLELHGDFAEHTAMLRKCGVTDLVPLRQAKHLDCPLDAVVLPGGESTVMGKLLVELGMLEAVQTLASRGTPMLGTCAGLILLAKSLPQYPDQPRIGALDVVVDRNTYGSQIASCQAVVKAEDGVFADGKPLDIVLIRAPGVVSVGPSVQVLADYNGSPILVRQGSLLAYVWTESRKCKELCGFRDIPTARELQLEDSSSDLHQHCYNHFFHDSCLSRCSATFHPEMTTDTRVHEMFLEMACARKQKLGHSTVPE